MHKRFSWLMFVLVASLVAPLAKPVAAGESQRASVAAPTHAGPDVSDVRVGTPAVFETFRSNNGNWTLGTTSSGDRSIADGMLIINQADKNTITWSIYDGQPDEFDDFYLEVDTLHLAGPLENNYGITFRMQDSDNLYLFDIDALGQYHFSKLKGDQWQTIVEWTGSTALNKGRGCENSLGILAIGDWIVLLANDKELKRVRDTSFSGGWIALMAGAYDKGNTEVGFDNLRLWQARTGGSSGLTVRRAGNATVTSDTLNVRSGPSTAYPVVATLRKGDRVSMVGRSADSQWVKISLDGRPQAWIAARYLSPDVHIQSLAVATAPRPPTSSGGSACGNKAYLLLENHIGRYITVQVSNNNFRIDGKVGDVPGTARVILNGTGRYTVAAQLPNGGSTNFDIFVEPTPDRCANRTGCLALCQTMTIPFWVEH